MPKKLSQEEFISRSIAIHNGKYDYSKVIYENSTKKVCIICPKHGEFWQTPHSHLQGIGCCKCGKESAALHMKKTSKEFAEEASIIHGGKYDYSNVNYERENKKVCIICPKHGEFWQTPHNHLNGAGCPICKYEKISAQKKDTKESFIKKAINVHGNKYDYSKVDYVDSHTKVCIICPEHGEFWQKPNNHIHGWGCSKCSGMKKRTTEEFIAQSKSVFGEKYDYSETEYLNNKKRVLISCKIHGPFSVYPNDHLRGQECPKCSMYKLEKEISVLLNENGIKFLHQYTDQIFGNQKIDFYLPEQKIAIECQGEQHFKPVKFFGGEEKLKTQKAWDKRKKMLCEQNGITILYYMSKNTYDKYGRLTKNAFFEKDGLLKIIKSRSA